jgi:hypothetical protein
MAAVDNSVQNFVDAGQTGSFLWGQGGARTTPATPIVGGESVLLCR